MHHFRNTYPSNTNTIGGYLIPDDEDNNTVPLAEIYIAALQLTAPTNLSTVSIPYSYRYGFCAKQGEERAVSFAIPRYSGKRQEREQQLNQSITSAEYWFYDGRLGRRWNVDPVDQVSMSNYSVLGNNPICFLDPNGADWYSDKDGNNVLYTDSEDEKYTTETGMELNNIGDKFSFYELSGNTVIYSEYIKDKLVNLQTYDIEDCGIQYGELWETDNEQEAIFPVGTNLSLSWNKIGNEGYYYTKNRKDMVQIMRDNPGTYQFYMPRTNQALTYEKAFQDGGRDAAILVSGTVGIIYLGGSAPLLYSTSSDYILTQSVKSYIWISSNIARSALLGTSSSTIGLEATNLVTKNNWIRFGWGYGPGGYPTLRLATGAATATYRQQVLDKYGMVGLNINQYMRFFFGTKGHFDILKVGQ